MPTCPPVSPSCRVRPGGRGPGEIERVMVPGRASRGTRKQTCLAGQSGSTSQPRQGPRPNLPLAGGGCQWLWDTEDARAVLVSQSTGRGPPACPPPRLSHVLRRCRAGEKIGRVAAQRFPVLWQQLLAARSSIHSPKSAAPNFLMFHFTELAWLHKAADCCQQFCTRGSLPLSALHVGPPRPPGPRTL